MAYGKLANRLEGYLERLSKGKAHKIRPHDIEKVIHKLKTRRAELETDLGLKPEKADKIKDKISILDDLLARAAWLRAHLKQGAEIPPSVPGSTRD